MAFFFFLTAVDCCFGTDPKLSPTIGLDLCHKRGGFYSCFLQEKRQKDFTDLFPLLALQSAIVGWKMETAMERTKLDDDDDYCNEDA